MAVTIYDVAERAEVGIGTVSRVLNNSPHVREKTRQRVFAAIEALNYRPSPIAQRLSLRKTLTIGVIAPFFTRPSFVERLRGIEAAIAESEYDLIVYNVETTAKRDACFREIPASQRVDGLIVISLSPSDEDVARWAEDGVPIVLVDAHHPALSRVVVDDVVGGYMATQHLIELDHRKIAYLSNPLDNPFNFTSSRDRYEGYRQALTDHGLPFRPEYHQESEGSRPKTRSAAHRLLNLDDPPTAIFAASDTRAISVLEALKDRGLKAPDDVAVIGYDDIEIVEYLGLSTIRQPLFETGTMGVELLLKRIDDPKRLPLRVELPLELVVRQTTAG